MILIRPNSNLLYVKVLEEVQVLSFPPKRWNDLAAACRGPISSVCSFQQEQHSHEQNGEWSKTSCA